MEFMGPPFAEGDVSRLIARVRSDAEELAELTASASELADQDHDGCHHALTAAGIACGSLIERVEDIIEERDQERSDAGRSALQLLELELQVVEVLSDLPLGDMPPEACKDARQLLARVREYTASARERSREQGHR